MDRASEDALKARDSEVFEDDDDDDDDLSSGTDIDISFSGLDQIIGDQLQRHLASTSSSSSSMPSIASSTSGAQRLLLTSSSSIMALSEQEEEPELVSDTWREAIASLPYA